MQNVKRTSEQKGSNTLCSALTGCGCMKGDRENNKGSHSLLSIPLCAILCCLNEEWKKRGGWLGRTLEKDIPWRLRLSRSLEDSVLIELFTCMQAAARSLSFTPTRHVFIRLANTTQPLHTPWSSSKSSSGHRYVYKQYVILPCRHVLPVFTCVLLVCLVSRPWSGTSRAVNLTLWPACTPSS